MSYTVTYYILAASYKDEYSLHLFFPLTSRDVVFSKSMFFVKLCELWQHPDKLNQTSLQLHRTYRDIKVKLSQLSQTNQLIRADRQRQRLQRKLHTSCMKRSVAASCLRTKLKSGSEDEITVPQSSPDNIQRASVNQGAAALTTRLPPQH